MSPRTILLAESEHTLAVSIILALSSEGHQVESVKNGKEVLAKLRNESGRFDLLIIDLDMRYLGGIELIQRLSETPFRGGILVISAYLSRDLRETLKGLGIDHILAKPFDIAELRALVSEVGKADSAALTWAKLLKFMQIGLEDTE